MTAVPGQAQHRECRQEPRQRDPRKRPPDRDRLVVEMLRQVLVHGHLQLVHPLQE